MRKKKIHCSKSVFDKPFVRGIAAATFLLAIPVCFYITVFTAEFSAKGWQFDGMEARIALRKPASYSKVAEARWERFAEAKVEYDNLKQILFGVVDNTKITPKSNSFSIDIYDFPHCIVGISINQVVAPILFSEVIQNYITWATINGWRYEEKKIVSEHSGETRLWYHLFTDPGNATVTQTWLMIEALSLDRESAIFQSFYLAHYKFHLAYVDHSCDED